MNTEVIDADEIWRPVHLHKGLYSVSNYGRVRAEPKIVQHSNGRVCKKKQKVMSPGQSKKSLYQTVRLLGHDGAYTTHHVHALVLEAFSEPRPAGMEACHRDGDRENNAASNLRWDTRSGNHADKNVHGTSPVGERHPMHKLDNTAVLAIRARRAQGASATQLSEEFNVSRMTAFRAATGRSWSHL